MSMKILLILFALFTAMPAFAQQDTAQLSDSQLKQLLRQQKRDSIRAHKKVWISVLGGPSYNPEASFGIGGAALMSFRMASMTS